MPVDEAPEDDAVRQSYNFCPGYFSTVYRADVPDAGAGRTGHDERTNADDPSDKAATEEEIEAYNEDDEHKTKFKLQSMKWGLIPFWTKRNPDYGSMLKTINCRDDSLIENKGLWTSMKQRKRCIILCQGFYEWLKKNNGKDRLPYYTKRKDGQLMCFAGLWDCVQYEGSEEKLYTYTVITTNSNKQLSFLHDRMPVILENGSDAVRTWLDPNRTEWTPELQSLLKPFEGELECYPVSKDVGKVGNNSAQFIVPLDSKDNKSNIANFFGKAREKTANGKSCGAAPGSQSKPDEAESKKIKLEINGDEAGPAQAHPHGGGSGTGNDSDAALLKAPISQDQGAAVRGIKREHEHEHEHEHEVGEVHGNTAGDSPSEQLDRATSQPPSKQRRKMRSATSNGTAAKESPRKKGDGSQKITAFFGK